MTDLPPLQPSDLDATSCRRLWAAVMFESIKASVGYMPDHPRDCVAYRNDMKRAREWVGSRDFRTVAEFAGMDPEVIEEAFACGRITRDRITNISVHARGARQQAPSEAA